MGKRSGFYTSLGSCVAPRDSLLLLVASKHRAITFRLLSVCLVLLLIIPTNTPFEPVMAVQPSDACDENQPEAPPGDFEGSGEQSSLIIHAEFVNGSEIAGITIQIFSEGLLIQSGITPANFTLPRDKEVTVVARNMDGIFFSRWKDSKKEEMPRDVTVGQRDSLTAIFRNIPGAKVICVSADASLLDSDGTPYPLSAVGSNVQFANSKTIIDSGQLPRVFELAEGQMYNISATNSIDRAANNYRFSYWLDPITNETLSADTLSFNATAGLNLHVYYEPRDPKNDIIPLTSRLEDGTPIAGVYVKILRADSPPSDGPAAQGTTPRAFTLRIGQEYIAVASDCGVCFTGGPVVFDHWEAVGGPLISDRVLGDDFHFITGSVPSRVDSLVAVYRIVPDEDFASIRVDGTGSNVTTQIPEDVDGGLNLRFAEVIENGNVTASEISVVASQDLFENVSEGFANMTVFSGNGTGESGIFSTKGPVIRVNDANLILDGEIAITLPFDRSELPQGVNTTVLSVLHFNGTHWVDVTSADAGGEDGFKTGIVDSLSPFVIGWDSKLTAGGGEPVVVRRGGGGSADSKFGIGGVGVVVDQPSSVLTMHEGNESRGSFNLLPLGNNDTIDIVLKDVQSSGNLTVTSLDPGSRELAQNAGSSLNVDGSGFTLLGSLFNLTIDSSLTFTGDIDVSVPYNESALASFGSNYTEADTRLVYFDGIQWHDITTNFNETANKLTGTLTSANSTVLLAAVAVDDGTYGQAYFESNPQSRISLVDVVVGHNETSGGSSTQDMLADCADGQECVIALSGSIQNAQRKNQTYSILLQIKDAAGVVTEIQVFDGFLGGGQIKAIDLKLEFDETMGPGQYNLDIFVLGDLENEPILIGDVVELDIIL